MFIVWDKLFGTFEPERARPVYGITAPLASWNPLWANAHYWVELFRSAARTPGLRDRVLYFLKPPGWRPAALGGPIEAPPVDASTYRKFETPLAPKRAAYVAVHFAMLLVASAAFLFRQQGLDPHTRAAFAAVAATSLASLGTLLEERKVGFGIEVGRLALVSGAALFGLEGRPRAALLILAAGSFVFLSLIRGRVAAARS
jgi:alkylglycerol monooxygenase